MVLTTDQRIELMAKAREAKKLKKIDVDKSKPIPVKGRPKKKKDEINTLVIEDDIVKDIIDEVPIIDEVKTKAKKTKSKPIEKAESESSEAEVEEQIIYQAAKKKKKKKIIRKIIHQEQESSSEAEIEEEVIYQKKDKRTTTEPKKQTQQIIPIQRSNPFFCY